MHLLSDTALCFDCFAMPSYPYSVNTQLHRIIVGRKPKAFRQLISCANPSRARTGLLTLVALLALPLHATVQRAVATAPSAFMVTSPQDAATVIDPDIQRAVDAVYPALVLIRVVGEQGYEGRMSKQQWSGSGAIISADGYIITNHHVAGRSTRLTVRLPNREEVDATMVGTDPLSDLSVIKINPADRRDPSKPLPFAKFGDSDKLQVGDIVLAMGSPAGLSQSVTKGIVANTEMILPARRGRNMLDGEDVGELVRWIGHDAIIFGGNSGGPLVNLKGEIVGVNEVGIGSLGGAIPGNLAQAVSKELIAKGAMSRSWIGLDVQPLLKSMVDAKGVLVKEVMPDSPAMKAGIKPGDFITNYGASSIMDSRAAEDLPLFHRLILMTPIGSSVAMTGSRDGKPMTWQITTVQREPREAREVESKPWGLTVRDFTLYAALEEQRKDRKGVIVDTVRGSGPSSDAKPPLYTGDILLSIDGRAVDTVNAFQEVTRDITKEEKQRVSVLLIFERNKQQMVTVVKIGPDIEDDKPARSLKAWMGVQTQVLTTLIAKALGVEGKKGVRITRVMPNSPAAKAGIKVGDIFLKMDDQVIAASTPSDNEVFDTTIRAYKVGSTVELTGLRAGEPLKISALLEPEPKPSNEFKEYKDDRFEFTVRELSIADRVEAKLGAEVQGILVSAVARSGWTDLAGLEVNDVIMTMDGKSMESVAMLKDSLQAFRQTKPRRIVFFVRRGVHTEYVEIEPQW